MEKTARLENLLKPRTEFSVINNMSERLLTGTPSSSLPILNDRSSMTLRSNKRFWRIAIILLSVALPLYYFTRSGTAQPKYITAEVSRGPIIRAVIATGTVNPVVTVQIGSYVSGPITAIYDDFNV